MHPNFAFTTRQVLFTLTFAAQWVFLVVLLGRDRARRYPWFTASVALYALQLMAEVLLSGRMAIIPLQEILLTIDDLGVIAGLLVLVELARQAFAGAQRSLRVANTLGLVVVAGGVLATWGPWPAWKDLPLDTLLGKLKLMQLAAQKGDTLVALLTVGVALLVVLFGSRFKAGWRSHTQKIVIGLSAPAIALLTLQGTLQHIIKTAHPTSRVEYDHVMGLLTKLVNTNSAIYLAALLWWIVWLWLDEPGEAKTPAAETAAQ